LRWVALEAAGRLYRRRGRAARFRFLCVRNRGSAVLGSGVTARKRGAGVSQGYLARRAPTRPNIRPSKNPALVWRCPAEETPPFTASPSSKMVRPSPGPFPLPAIPVLPYLSVLVGWCCLAGLVHTVPLSLAGYLEGYLTTELLPTGPPLLWQLGGPSTTGLCQSLPLTQKVRRPDA